MPRPTPDHTRREGIPAVEAELADGITWGFALPGPRLHPDVRREADPFGRPRVQVEVAARFGYPLEIWRLSDDLSAACHGGDEARSRDAFLRLAVALLRSAHDLELEDAEALLDPGRVDLDRLARILIPAAFGDADPNHPDGR